MTLITERIGSGPTRRCDATCHKAKRPACRCICGGMNHGVGLQQAQANTQETYGHLLHVLTGARACEQTQTA